MTTTSELFPRASRLGFGCASLGSRVGRARGLDALSAAFSFGVNWFDVAPSYGDGQAETILAEFARDRRHGIHICTKCGIEPGRVGPASKILRPLARSIVRELPHLRSYVAANRPAAAELRLSAELVRGSIDRSLTRLGTDYVDVYALHDPSLEALDDDRVLRALEDAASAGKARVIGVAGSLEAAIRARALGLPFRFVQLAAPSFSAALGELGRSPCAGPPPMTSIHSVLSAGGWSRKLAERAGSRERLQRLLTQHGYEMPLDAAVRALLIDDALDRNADGLVLASMLSRDHARQNAARLGIGPAAARGVMGELDIEVARS